MIYVKVTLGRLAGGAALLPLPLPPDDWRLSGGLPPLAPAPLLLVEVPPPGLGFAAGVLAAALAPCGVQCHHLT